MPTLNFSSSFSNILEVMISLGFIYFLLSILVSIIVEQLSHYTKLRSRFLMQWIEKLLNDPANQNYGYLLYNHPLVDALKTDRGNPSKYIAASTFSQAFIDVIAKQARQYSFTKDENGNWLAPEEDITTDKVTLFWKGVNQMNPSAFKDLLMSFLKQCCVFVKAEDGTVSIKDPVASLPLLQTAISGWYTTYLERVTGHYKKETNKLAWLASAAVVLLLNIDSLHLIKVLKEDDSLRKSLVEGAEKVVAEQKKMAQDSVDYYRLTINALAKTDTGKQDTATQKRLLENFAFMTSRLDAANEKAGMKRDSLMRIIEAYSLPIGWNEQEAPLVWLKQDSSLSLDHRKTPGFGNGIKYALGLLISMVALTFGAPFWFDVMNKFISLRRAGIKPKDLPDASQPK